MTRSEQHHRTVAPVLFRSGGGVHHVEAGVAQPRGGLAPEPANLGGIHDFHGDAEAVADDALWSLHTPCRRRHGGWHAKAGAVATRDPEPRHSRAGHQHDHQDPAPEPSARLIDALRRN